MYVYMKEHWRYVMNQCDLSYTLCLVVVAANIQLYIYIGKYSSMAPSMMMATAIKTEGLEEVCVHQNHHCSISQVSYGIALLLQPTLF